MPSKYNKIPLTKVCPACSIRKLRTSFTKVRGHKYYVTGYCKPCGAKRARIKRLKSKYSPQYRASVLLGHMKKFCKVKGFPVPEFNYLEIVEILKYGKCCKTGIKFSLNKHNFNRNPFAASPDRIDHKYGYSKKNTQWVVWIYNLMKADYTEKVVDEFIEGLINERR